MKIDWFTVIAQILNFLILVGLLRHFLYKPILKAIDEREKKIAAQLTDAETKKAVATKQQEDFKQKNEAFDKEKKALTDNAVNDANEQGKKLLEDARNNAAVLSAKLETASKEAQQNMNNELVQKTRQQVFTITRKALTDLASVSLEEQSAAMFIARLNRSSEDEKKKFNEAFKANNGPVVISSAFNLAEKQQTEIKEAVTKILGGNSEFQFKTTPELISGIELVSNGYKLAWSISEYLNSLEKSTEVNIPEASHVAAAETK